MATIEQSIDFKGVSSHRLYELYMDPKQHAAAIGGPVEIEPRVGGRFSALGGLVGRNLHIDSPRTVVQAWRANVWRDDDPDSILVLTFRPLQDGARVELVHTNVPDHVRQTIREGWHEHYWSRWAQYLAQEQPE